MARLHRLSPQFTRSIKIFLALGGLVAFSAAAVFAYYFITLPSPEDLTGFRVPESTKIYDRTGKVVLYDVHGEYKRTVVAFDEIPSFAVYATLVAEDANFYHHFGIDLKGILRAAVANLRGRKIAQGGSTITQQFIKNAFLSSERTFTRKIKEVILAVELELRYSKDQILAWYLNQVPYGSNAYGLESAAKTFFKKPARELALAEAATLAALPQGPTYYSPYGNHPEELSARKNYILERMMKLGYINEIEFAEAKEEVVAFAKGTSLILAPHFVFYVLEELEKTYGKEYLQSAGLEIRTSLDWDLEQRAEKLTLEAAEQNSKIFGGENAAAVVLDARTGEILAMVGSRDYFDESVDGNVNVTTRPRQPGSSFKPFAYVKAFEKGYTPDTIVFDVPTEFNPDCSPEGNEEKDAYGLICYHPQNYTETFRGPITLKEALAQSINVPAVKMLYLAGVAETIELAKKLGMQSLQDASQYGLSLVLGGGEVTLLEETSAYSAFATQGMYTPPIAVIEVKDSSGNVLSASSPKPERVLTEELAGAITSILSSDELRAPVFGRGSSLYTPTIPTAAKTGTTQKNRDAWTVGYTNDIVVGVWAGNNDGSFMNKGGGAGAAAPLWKKIVEYTYSERTGNDVGFTPPAPTQFPAYTPSPTGRGRLDGDFTSIRDESGYHSILYSVAKDSPRGGGNSRDDVQFAAWERAVQLWARDSGLAAFTPDPAPPAKPDNNPEVSSQKDKRPEITLTAPRETHLVGERPTLLEARFQSFTSPILYVAISLDEEIIFNKKYTSDEASFAQSVAMNLYPPQIKTAGGHPLTLEVRDYNEQSAQTTTLLFFGVEEGT